MQMTPELENKAFSGKSTEYIQSKRHKESYNTAFETFQTNYVAGSAVTDK
jgi:hypothetical protein